MKKAINLFMSFIMCAIIYGQDTVSLNKTVNTKEYGGIVSAGIALGGGGIVGCPIRLFFAEKFALEAGVFARPVFKLSLGNNSDSDDNYFGMNVAFIGGPIIYFSKKYIPVKDKVRMNGMFAKVGGSFGNRYDELIFGTGWAYERIKARKKNKSFSFELGLGVFRIHDKEFVPQRTWYYSEDESLAYSWGVMVYWKVAWNFYGGRFLH